MNANRYPSQAESAWILSLRLYGIRVLSIREEGLYAAYRRLRDGAE